MNEQNKVWFVTGTSTGFGRSLAEALIAGGERVVVTARDPGTLSDLVRSAPERVLALRLDVTKSEKSKAPCALPRSASAQSTCW